MRKAIQLIECSGAVVALCDDGTIWIVNDEGGWVQSPEIPQPAQRKAAQPWEDAG